MASDVVLIPVKGLDTGKSRLADVLGPLRRHGLNRIQLKQTMCAAADAFGVDRTFIISPCDQVEELVRHQGLQFIRERVPPGLNEALEQGRSELLAQGVRSISVLPVDLPGVSGDVLRELLHGCWPGESVIVPDRVAEGTNFMRVPSDCAVPFSYGPGSFATHVRLLAQAGFVPRVIGATCLRDDLDDVTHLRQHGRYGELWLA